MFLIPALTALMTYVYLRPQEVFELFRPVTIMSVLAVVALAYVLDLRFGFSRPRFSPVTFALAGLFTVSVVSLAVKAPDRLSEQLPLLMASLLSFLFVSQGLQSLRAIGVASAVLLGLTLVMAVVGIHQGMQTPMCYRTSGEDTIDGDVLEPRACESPRGCSEGGIPGADYVCEHPGLFGTHSIGRRVRFRGLLEDPNELAMAISMGLPLAFGLYERKRSSARLALLLVSLVLSFTCVIMTKSRSGQLSLLAVMAVYFVRRFGWRGLVGAGLATAPLLLLGGRSGAEAESSSAERLECWAEGLAMWRESPLIGVGYAQFGEHHYLTAHSSFVLTLAELGPLGLFIWSVVIYAAFKITVRAQIDFARRPDAAVARSWATALFASLAGLLISAFFLSIPYNSILWLFFGMVCAFSGAVRGHDPNWRVRFGWRDFFLVGIADVALVTGLSVFLRLKGV
jgi:hypothetical protein